MKKRGSKLIVERLARKRNSSVKEAEKSLMALARYGRLSVFPDDVEGGLRGFCLMLDDDDLSSG